MERSYEGDDIWVSQGMYLHLFCTKNSDGTYDVILIRDGSRSVRDVEGMCLREGLTREELDDLLSEESTMEIFAQTDEILSEAERYAYSYC